MKATSLQTHGHRVNRSPSRISAGELEKARSVTSVSAVNSRSHNSPLSAISNNPSGNSSNPAASSSHRASKDPPEAGQW